jgi:hypothetical protein
MHPPSLTAMNSTASPPHNREQASPIFSVIALHDDFAAGIRAQEAVEWLKHSLGSDLRITFALWSFQSLERLDVRAMSLRAAAVADVVIVSASETEPVPEQIKRWLDSLLQHQRDFRAVLVALHDDGQPACASPGPLCSYLENEATRWRTDFMCNKDFDHRLDRDYAMQSIGQKSHEPHVLNQPPVMSSYSASIGWGINE